MAFPPWSKNRVACSYPPACVPVLMGNLPVPWADRNWRAVPVDGSAGNHTAEPQRGPGGASAAPQPNPTWHDHLSTLTRHVGRC